MAVFLPIILVAWLLIVAATLLLCVAVRRTDEELSRAELAPVIDLAAHQSRSRQHVA